MAERALTKNAADPEQQREAKRKEARLVQLEREDFIAVMTSVQGRRFVYRMLEEFGVLTQTYHRDPYEHAFNAGRRDMAIRLMRKIDDWCPDLYSQMAKDYREARENS